MNHCTRCRHLISPADRYCPGCGEELGGETLAVESPAATPNPPQAPPLTTGLRSGEQFGERYRIVERLGRGGMGEVYRAEDRRLGETVALKLLPPDMANDPASLARLRDEVRIARQVTHRNVCRVFDLGEVDGVSFISMEYVDGEDLGTLLQRIGRFPAERGVEIAQQICQGLTAAHDRGVVHRDLKPANIMVDAEGCIRLADFGIASLADECGTGFVGTPAYMAPELFDGVAASVASDVYSLGLVLHELFTGKRAISGETLAEIRDAHHASARPSTTTHLSELNPDLVDLIARCLAVSPAARPTSAREVLAGLPGVDALALAVAAGETPSPELVAAAGGLEILPGVGWRFGILAWVVLGVALVALSHRQTTILELVRPELSPDVLRHRAQEILTTVGYNEKRVDWDAGFFYSDRLLNRVEEIDGRPERWQRFARPDSGLIRYWYRQSPFSLTPRSRWGRVGPGDPPPGYRSANLQLYSDGRLRSLEIEPPPNSSGNAPSVQVDWAAVLDLAGLDPDQLETCESTSTPPTAYDDRRAWRGPHPTLPDVTLVVDGASFEGHPVYFRQSPTLHIPELRSVPPRRARWSTVSDIMGVILLLGSLIGGVGMGWHNLRLKRSDSRRATRLALACFLLGALSFLLRTHTLTSLDLILTALSRLVFDSALAWFLYMALEPTVRRLRPRNLVSWTRLLSGRWRDRRVGFDVLVGIAVGVGVGVMQSLHIYIAEAISEFPPRPLGFAADLLLTQRYIVAQILQSAAGSVIMALTAVFLFVVLCAVGRRVSVGLGLLLLVGTARMPWAVYSESVALDLGVQLVVVAAILAVVVRWGLLAAMATIFTLTLLLSLTLSLRTDAWYFSSTLWILLAIVGPALVGTMISGGRRAVPRT